MTCIVKGVESLLSFVLEQQFRHITISFIST